MVTSSLPLPVLRQLLNEATDLPWAVHPADASEVMGAYKPAAEGDDDWEVEGEHTPCCSAHGVTMSCARYRRTHFVEVRPCCSADAALLAEQPGGGR